MDEPDLYESAHVSPPANSASVRTEALRTASPGATTCGTYLPSIVGPPDDHLARYSTFESTLARGPASANVALCSLRPRRSSPSFFVTNTTGTSTVLVDSSPCIFMNPVSTSWLTTTTATAPASTARRAFVPNEHPPRRTTAIDPTTSSAFVTEEHAVDGTVSMRRFSENACVEADESNALPFTARIFRWVQCLASRPETTTSQGLYTPSQ